ncbi:aspartate aminotransferase family protein [Burkholderia sp. Bp9012]|uniref:pyridoxal phosphate-dependent decarboxylase family protein n=2 Tax=Burkholderia TaxID=32008 RepID=UPI0021AB4848|nr:aspartate aminotransferase family protein [Burkholderia sp. Bp9012]
MQEMKAHDWDVHAGRLPLHAYYAGAETMRVAEEAFMMFVHQNQLAPGTFPNLACMEAEVVSMVCALFHGGDGATGSATSGGSESIMLALKAARDRAVAVRGEISSGRRNIVIPASAHPVFDKGARLLGLDVVRVGLDAAFRCRVDAMADAIDENTILLAGSVPSLPFGSVDPIEDIAQLASARGLWCHVDACIGGMVAPFASELGHTVPPFDFHIPGVTSISTDLHKFGYALKGISLILYTDADHAQYQAFAFQNWPKGRYETPTLLGSRSGGPLASAWAVMQYLGRAGYAGLTRRLMRLRGDYLERIADIPELTVLGTPPLSVLAVASPSLDMFGLASEMTARGWFMSLVAEPLAFQQTLTLAHERTLDEYCHDLREIIKKGTQAPDSAVVPTRRWEITTY